MKQLKPFLHEIWPLAVDEGAEGQAVPPGRGQVGDGDSSVALSLLLTPGQQLPGTHVSLCRTEDRVLTLTVTQL